MKNTHLTGLIGLLALVVGFLSQPSVSNILTSVLPANDAEFAAAVIAFLGAVAAYLGRPVTVPSSPTTTVTVTPPTPATIERKDTTL